MNSIVEMNGMVEAGRGCARSIRRRCVSVSSRLQREEMARHERSGVEPRGLFCGGTGVTDVLTLECYRCLDHALRRSMTNGKWSNAKYEARRRLSEAGGYGAFFRHFSERVGENTDARSTEVTKVTIIPVITILRLSEAGARMGFPNLPQMVTLCTAALRFRLLLRGRGHRSAASPPAAGIHRIPLCSAFSGNSLREPREPAVPNRLNPFP